MTMPIAKSITFEGPRGYYCTVTRARSGYLCTDLFDPDGKLVKRSRWAQGNYSGLDRVAAYIVNAIEEHKSKETPIWSLLRYIK